MKFNLDNLNPEQREAVLHGEGPMLVLAGAGSGKTRVLVSRIQRLLEEDSQRGICALTFTNKAAKELRERVQQQLDYKVKALWTGTFHSFGLQLMRKYAKRLNINKHFSVMDSGDAQAVVKDLLMNIRNSRKEDFRMDKILNVMNDLRAGQKPNETWDEEYTAIAQVLLEPYQKRMRQLGVVDFEDLLLKPIQLFRENPDIYEKVQDLFPYLMVDEFQDTNETQMNFLKLMTQKRQNITVVGDDDQAIYGWRGAQVKNILHFPRLYENCRTIQLERNYRSSGKILQLANAVIKNNKDRHGKVLKAEKILTSEKIPEVFVFENDQEEVERVGQLIQEFRQDGYRYADIAILYRSNGQGGFLETELRLQQVPYKITGGTGFFERREVKDIVAYLQCLRYPKEVDFRRVLNVPQRGIGDETFHQIEGISELHGLSFVVACRRAIDAPTVPDKGRQGLHQFFSHIAQLKQRLHQEPRPDYDQVLSRFFMDIGYRDYLRKYCKNDEALSKRWYSVDVVARVFANFLQRADNFEKGLGDFLDMMSLRDFEMEDREAKDQVQLLTLHGAKGLEYPVVILMGVEEDLLPHRSLGQDTSEERRLFYVGITRAQEQLLMTRTRYRKRFGKMQEIVPSRFLLEVEPTLFTTHEGGYRPLAQSSKDDLLASLKAELEAKMQSQSVD